MKIIRKIISKFLGLKRYLQLVSKIYILLVKNNFLKEKYPELFFLKEIIKPGFVCVDIGANLGYYSIFISKLIGNNGKLFAVEPISLFQTIWKKNMLNSNKNYELLPFALGEKNHIVQMGIPVRDGIIRHGLTKITSSASEDYSLLFDVEMKVPDELFSNTHIDFIKCDVEGYESLVFENFKCSISKYKPIVQSELSGEENRTKVINIFRELEYDIFVLRNNKLISATEEIIKYGETDFYFIPKK